MSYWYPGSSDSYEEYLKRERLLDDFEDRARKVGTEVSEYAGAELESVKRSVYDVQSQLTEFNANFKYTMGLLIKQISWNSEVLNGLVDKVDGVKKILESPKLTQAREYFWFGKDNFDKGLLIEALRFFLESEKEYNADYFTQSMLGTLYLYGVNLYDDVVDPVKAEQHFRLAARYANAEKKRDEGFTKLEVESLFHASIAIYVQLGEKSISNDKEKSKVLLSNARKLAIEASELYREGIFLESEYHVAKYSSLLEEPEIAIPVLKKVILANRDYKKKAEEDPAFEPVRAYVTATISNLRKSRKNESQKLLELNELFRDFFLRIGLDNSSSYMAAFSMFSSEVDLAKGQITNDNYFGFLDAIEILENLLTQIPDLVASRFDELLACTHDILKFIEREKPSGNTYSTNVQVALKEINSLVTTIKYKLKEAGASSEIKNRINIFTAGIRTILQPPYSKVSPSKQTFDEITQVENRYDYMTEKSDVHKFLELVYQEGFLLLKDAIDLAHLASEKATEAEVASRQNLTVVSEICDFLSDFKYRDNWRSIKMNPGYEQLLSLISEIEGLLNIDTNEALNEASRLMQETVKLERLLSEDWDRKSRARIESIKNSEKYARLMVIVCGVIGGIVVGFSGLGNSLYKSSSLIKSNLVQDSWYTSINFFSGLFLGCPAGVLVGVLLVALWKDIKG